MEPHPYKDPFIHPWLLLLLCFILLLSLPDASFAQTARSSPPYEPENPFPLLQPDIDRWNYLAPGLHGSYGSIDMRYERDIVPLFTEQRSWSACAWRGEKVDLQLILWSSTGIRQVRCEPTEFKNEKGALIGPSSVQAWFVRYLISENEFTDCGRRGPLNQRVFHLDLWQNPWAVARYHDVKPWSAEHIALLKPLLKMLGDAGEKCITTTLISHPWNAQTYDAYES